MVIGAVDILANIAVITAGLFNISNSDGVPLIEISGVSFIICASLSLVAATLLIFGAMKVSLKY